MNRLKPSRVTTPDEFLKAHPITHALIDRGWTADELDASRFFNWNPKLRFRVWAMAPARLAPTDFGLLKAYLALQWLALDNPGPSRNRDDAWAYIASVLAAPLIDAGLGYSRSQRRRAKAPRGILCDGGLTLNQLIGDLATKPAYADLKPGELWPHLIAALDEVGLSPVEYPCADNRPKARIEYDGRTNPRKPDVEPKRKTISFGRFRTVVARARRNGRITPAND